MKEYNMYCATCDELIFEETDENFEYWSDYCDCPRASHHKEKECCYRERKILKGKI